MSQVAIDTQVLTWMMQAVFAQRIPVRQKKPPGTPAELAVSQERKDQASALLQELREAKTTILIPSLVLGEFLFAVPSAKHRAAMEIIAHGFAVIPYDILAAQVFAELWKLRAGDGTIDNLKALAPPATRNGIRADLIVVATAIRWKADVLYSHDHDVKTLAQGKITVREMPPRKPMQTDLPLEMPKS